MAIIFDIETIGVRFETLPEGIQERLLRTADSEEEREERRGRTGLSPFTGEVVCAALHNTASGGGQVLYRPGSQPAADSDGVRYIPFEEEAPLLARFWELVAEVRKSRESEHGTLVTYNGRAFDIPYLEIRSAIRRVKPSCRMLRGSRFEIGMHIDLQEQLTFYGATRPSPSLDLVCHAFGVESPKTQDAQGSRVQALWEEGRGGDIARYCYRDVVATGEVYARWRDFMRS